MNKSESDIGEKSGKDLRHCFFEIIHLVCKPFLDYLMKILSIFNENWLDQN